MNFEHSLTKINAKTVSVVFPPYANNFKKLIIFHLQLEEERRTFRNQTLAKRGLSTSLHDLTIAAAEVDPATMSNAAANSGGGTLRRGGHHAVLCKSVSRLSTVSTESMRTGDESTTTTLSSSSGSSGSLAAALQSEIRRRAEKSTGGKRMFIIGVHIKICS